MTIDIDPETERLVRAELQRGAFRSVDEIVVSGIRARRDDEERRAQHQDELRQAVERALEFAKDRAISLRGLTIEELLHERHRV